MLLRNNARNIHVDLWDARLFEGTFEKVPSSSPKTPQTKGIATHGRKCEHSASFFRAAKGSFRAPVLQYRFWSLPRSLIDFFEASPYGVFANSGGGVILWGAVFLGGAICSRGLLKKSPRAPPKLLKNRIGTHGRKGEHSASFFRAAKGSFRAPFVRRRLWSLPLPLVDFFEASPYGAFANGGGGVKMHGTRRLRDVRERARLTKRLRTAR